MAEPAPDPVRPPLGLSAGELQAAVHELRAQVVHGAVVDVVRRKDHDDLLLWLRAPAAPAGKLTLHVVPGGQRGRITLTTRRFGKHELAAGPASEALRTALVGAELGAVEATPGERIASLRFQPAGGAAPLRLVVELFGNRGLWLLLDAKGTVLALSRVPHGRDRVLRPGSPWQPPPPRPAGSEPPPRFAPPVLAAIDALFTAADRSADSATVRAACARVLVRAQDSVAQRIAGLRRQREQGDRAPALRARADLMLAYAAGVPRGATSMRVPDPDRAGAELELPLLPDRPVVVQAQALYERARRLADALAVVADRLAQAERDAAALAGLAERLAAAADLDALAAVQEELQARKLLPGGPRAPAAKRPRAERADESYRRFVSIDGAEILCGRTNEQNERLTLRTARGNDVWLHVGRGHAGSHVIVRVPRGKSASLATLLDAAAIAVHFSKARDADKAEVVYTQAKHVRKAKGAPAGTVIPHHTKTLFVRADAARLQRLLATGGTP